jgi:hypothetical protein
MKFYIETLVRWAVPKAGALPKRPAEQTPAAAPPKNWWSRDGRVSKTTQELESTITEAVKAAPGCEAFVGVIVQRTTPSSRSDPTWEIRGIKFGLADRKLVMEALTPIVERLQREFRLIEGPIKSPIRSPKSPVAD